MHFAFVAIALVHFGLGLGFGFVTPIWESYDEPSHFAYAIDLALDGKPPQESDVILNFERIQPPFYYFILAAFFRLSGSPIQGFSFPKINPYFYMNPLAHNYALHPLHPSEHDKEIAATVMAARIFSLLLSLLGITFTFLAAKLLWPHQNGIQVTSTFIFALWPISLFHSSVVTNDSLMPVAGALVTWIIIKLCQKHFRASIFFGGLLMICIGITTKISMIVFVVPFFVASRFAIQRVHIVVFWLCGAIFLLTIILLANTPAILIPFVNHIPDGQDIFTVAARRLTEANLLEFITNCLRYLVDTSFGLFGWGNLLIPDWLLFLWKCSISLSGVGYLIFYRGKHRLPRFVTIILLSIITFFLISTLSLAWLYQNVFLVSGRYLLPALPAFTFLLMAGWSAISQHLFPRVMAIGLLICDLLIPVYLIVPVYELPPPVTAATISHQQVIELAPGLTFVGYRQSVFDVYAGDLLPIDVFWEAVRAVDESYIVHIDLLGDDGQIYGSRESFPVDGSYLTRDWLPNKPFKDQYAIRVRSDLDYPVIAHFRISLSRPEHTVFYEFGEFNIHIGLNSHIPLLPQNESPRFGSEVFLRGNQVRLVTNNILAVELIWQAASTTTDRMLQITLRDSVGYSIKFVKSSRYTAGLHFPASHWLPDELVADRQFFSVPDGLFPGRYSIHIVLIEPQTGNKIPVKFGVISDSLEIAELQIDNMGQLQMKSELPLRSPDESSISGWKNVR